MAEKLVFPGHIADLKYIIPALKVYADVGDWVSTNDYIAKEFSILKSKGIEDEMKSDKTDYTKDAELLRYFGLVERREPGNTKAECRISKSGKIFYEAYIKEDYDQIWEVLMTSFETVTFGRNNEGCPSCNTKLEAPNILLISSLILDGVTRQEYASILWQMLYGGLNMVSAIMKIKLCRLNGESYGDMVRVDNKVVPFLINLKFLEEDQGKIIIPKIIKERYQNRIAKLKATNDELNVFQIELNMEETNNRGDRPKQKIIYGAPGTGKSFRVNEDTNGEAVVRTTFHPDSDYSTFVGAYKPTTTDETVMTVIGTKAVPVENGDGNERIESKIIYEFVIQAFLKAYLAAWKKYSEDSENPKAQYLVIEEINRGNCAQIFGDLFQLLDRSDNGFSTYPIEADTDLQKIISKKFKEKGGLYQLNDNFNIDDKVEDYTSNYNATLTDDIKEGRVLLLPKNLYIWATMNTSDQSLFPIDSAFKRRWDWEYIPIDKGYDKNGNELDWFINIDEEKYSWWVFLQIVNNEIFENTHSEDKQLGFFFCKAVNNEINAEKFVSKVVFYLWNDVFKDFEGNKVFGNLKFRDFYAPQGKRVEINIDTVKKFLQGLKVDSISEILEENGKPFNKKRYQKVLDIIERINEIGPEKLATDQELKKFKVQGGVDLIGNKEILKDSLPDVSEGTYKKYRSEQYTLNNGYFLALYGLYSQQLDEIRAILNNR